MAEQKKRGGARPGAGRKKGVPMIENPENRRTKRIVILATPAQEQLLKEKARAAGMTVSSFLLKLGVEHQHGQEIT